MAQYDLNSTDKIFTIALVFWGLSILIFGYIAPLMGLALVPFEDAAMLMRYASNFANGSGITWNAGDSPVDGCTDFLFMIIVSLLIKLGLRPEASVYLIALFSHIATTGIIYLTIRKIHAVGRNSAILSSMIFTIGPGLLYIFSFWGTPFFALFISITWFFALNLVLNKKNNVSSFLFALFSLLSGLTRPDGVFLSLFILLSVIYMNGIKESKRLITIYITLFLIFGGGYFIWRWDYFGYPLPNPFYRKGGGNLYFDGLLNSIKNTLIFGFLTIPAIIIGLKNKDKRRKLLFLLIPVVGYSLIWVLISPEMNYMGRFQYSLFPIFLMSWPMFVGGIKWNLKILTFKNKVIYIVILLLFSIILLGGLNIILKKYGAKYVSLAFSRDGRMDVGLLIKKYKNKDYKLATSEAGLLPYYSEWKSLDTWGLNDKWIAHNDLITEKYLNKYYPHLIMFHSKFPFKVEGNLENIEPRLRKTKWRKMIQILYGYAVDNNYTLAAVYGIKPGSCHYYFVRNDFIDSEQIISEIRGIDYYWIGKNKICINFVSQKPE